MINVQMLKMQGENDMIIHVVLSKSLILYLQLKKLELIGDLGSVEEKCREDVNVKYLFLLLLPVYIRNLATSESLLCCSIPVQMF